jgi:hypothetical protein
MARQPAGIRTSRCQSVTVCRNIFVLPSQAPPRVPWTLLRRWYPEAAGNYATGLSIVVAAGPTLFAFMLAGWHDGGHLR